MTVTGFVALRDLSLNGVGAFNKGDAIDAGNEGVAGRYVDGNLVAEPQWVEGEDYAAVGTEEAEEAITGPQRPAMSASKAAWVDYAEALHADGHPLGLDRATAEARTRDEIIAHIDGQLG